MQNTVPTSRKSFISGNVRRNERVYLNRVAQIVLVTCLLSIPAAAQQADDLNAKFQAMEERIKALESEVSALKAALSTAPANTEAPAPSPAPIAAPPTVGATGAPQLSDATARLMNPAISMIGNVLGAAGHNPVDKRPSFNVVESELALSAAVDPYAKADVYLTFGEEGVEVEEAYMTFTALPAGLLLKAGRMRADFGKVNTMHRHVLPWVDRPLVNVSLLAGEDGIRDTGFSISRLLPTVGGLYLDATGELFRGNSSVIFQQQSRNDLTTVGHLRAYRDLSESTNLDLGFSFSRGHHAPAEVSGPYVIESPESASPGNVTLLPGEGNFLVSRIYGGDATIRWKPLRRSIYHSFVGRSEVIWHHRQEPLGLRKAFGYYASAEYQLARRWFAGVRIDRSGRIFGPAATDREQSAQITYWPSEFSQIRVEYRHGDYEGIGLSNELLFQLQFSIGSHGAHPF